MPAKPTKTRRVLAPRAKAPGAAKRVASKKWPSSPAAEAPIAARARGSAVGSTPKIVTAAATVTEAAKASSPAASAIASEGPRSEAKGDEKPVRDSFKMPQADYALFGELKRRALEARRPAKKSELLRAGLRALAKLQPDELAAALDALETVKTRRPAKR